MNTQSDYEMEGPVLCSMCWYRSLGVVEETQEKNELCLHRERAGTFGRHK